LISDNQLSVLNSVLDKLTNGGSYHNNTSRIIFQMASKDLHGQYS